jgi:hypothetical protein
VPPATSTPAAAPSALALDPLKHGEDVAEQRAGVRGLAGLNRGHVGERQRHCFADQLGHTDTLALRLCRQLAGEVVGDVKLKRRTARTNPADGDPTAAERR